MANKQTTRLRKAGFSLRFNSGTPFAHLSGAERARHPEFTIIELESTKGRCVDSSFANRAKTGNNRTRAWQGAEGAKSRPAPKGDTAAFVELVRAAA